MPCHRGHGNEIVLVDALDLLAHQAMTAAAQDQHGMHVLMAFEGRKTAESELEIAQLPVHVRMGKKYLPGNRLEQSAGIILVRTLLHALPAIALCLAVRCLLAIRHCHHFP